MNKLYKKNNFLICDNITYTIDMVRLRSNITYETFSKIEFYINTVWKHFEILHYKSSDISSFKENYVVRFSDISSFWLGFIHNSELSNKSLTNENTKYNLTFEFNPNKIGYETFTYIFGLTTDWKIQSVDVAMDVPVNILDLFCYDKKRKKSMRIFSNGWDDKTIYIGKSNNRVKIYNKKIESNLKNDLTRVEISSKINLPIKEIEKYKYTVALPDIYLNQYLYTFTDLEKKRKKDIYCCILYALQEGYDINDLPRTYKDNIKKMLRGGYKINFSNEMCTNVLKMLVKSMFPNYII